MPRKKFLPIFALLALTPHLLSQEGRLKQVRDEVAEERPAPPPSTSDADDSASILDEFPGWALVTPVTAPFVVPRWLMDDHSQPLCFPAYPYHRDCAGYLTVDAAASLAAAEKWGPANLPRWWMTRVTLEDGNDLSGLNRVGGQVLVDTACRFGILANWNYFHERLDKAGHDATSIGDLNVTYRFAQCERGLMRTGLGVRVLTDDYTTNWGVNFHYGGEWFPADPWVLTAAMDLGSLGGAFVAHGRATAGVVWNGWEAFAGYDVLRIGGYNLYGPMVGVRWWF